jgi:hypothetical protein
VNPSDPLFAGPEQPARHDRVQPRLGLVTTASQSPPPTKPRRKRLKALGSFAKKAGPAVAAALALVISGFTWWDAHRADQSAEIAAQRAYSEAQQADASKVSYWLLPSKMDGAAPTLVIRNGSDTAISEVTVWVNAVHGKREAPMFQSVPLLWAGFRHAHWTPLTFRSVARSSSGLGICIWQQCCPMLSEGRTSCLECPARRAV